LDVQPTFGAEAIGNMNIKLTKLAHHRKLYVTLIRVSLISKQGRKTGKFQILI